MAPPATPIKAAPVLAEAVGAAGAAPKDWVAVRRASNGEGGAEGGAAMNVPVGGEALAAALVRGRGGDESTGRASTVGDCDCSRGGV
jgi:hypothetical protein